MLRTPFYDPTKSYGENYDAGPFGAFADGKVFVQDGEPKADFLGHKVYTPFGIPAGPLLNSAFCKAAFEKGFDVCVYKTVRSDAFPCHPFPNVLAIHPEGDLSFMGTVKPNQTQQELIDDYVLAARLSNETGAHVLETNLSCPNIGNEGLICYNLDLTERIAKGIRDSIKDKKFILKVGYYQSDACMERLAEIANEYADSISGINTLQGEIRNATGDQALPGSPARLRSGVCGAGIRWAGLDFVKKLAAIRAKRNFKFSIEGVGGVLTPENYKKYRDAGADSVMSATGAMWNPYLAQEIKELHPNA